MTLEPRLELAKRWGEHHLAARAAEKGLDRVATIAAGLGREGDDLDVRKKRLNRAAAKAYVQQAEAVRTATAALTLARDFASVPEIKALKDAQKKWSRAGQADLFALAIATCSWGNVVEEEID